MPATPTTRRAAEILDPLRRPAILAAAPGIVDVSIPWSEQKYYAWAFASLADAPLLLARTGYTGEDGFALLVPAEHAAALGDAVLAAGQDHGLGPAGLAARH